MAVVFKMVSAAETGFIEDRNSAVLTKTAGGGSKLSTEASGRQSNSK